MTALLATHEATPLTHALTITTLVLVFGAIVWAVSRRG
jgi:hypothetical protein